MRSVNFNTIKTCFITPDCSVDIVLNQIVNFLCGKFMRCFAICWTWNAGRSSNLLTGHSGNCLTAGMVQLNDSSCTIIFQMVSQCCHTRDTVVCPQCRFVRHTNTASFHCGNFNDNQTKSTSCASSIIIQRSLTYKPFRCEFAGIHGWNYQTVLDHNITDFIRCKSFFEIHKIPLHFI